MDLTIANCQKVYNLLEDQKSQYIYLKRLNYLLSSDFKYIKDITPRHLLKSELPTYADANIPDDAKIVMYGTGICSRNCISEWKNDKRIVAFCSQNKEKHTNGYLGYPVISPQELIIQSEYFVVISVVNPVSKNEIMQILNKANYPVDKVIFLLDMQVDRGEYFPEDIIAFNNNEVFVDAG